MDCRELDLSECRGVSGSALQSILTGAMPALESIMLTGIPEVTNTLLAEMALGLPVRHLSVARCTAVNDEGLRGLAAACPHLLTLQADDCVKITDAGIVALAESCKELQVCVSDVMLQGLLMWGFSHAAQDCFNCQQQVALLHATAAASKRAHWSCMGMRLYHCFPIASIHV